jgi:hypothetical protein
MEAYRFVRCWGSHIVWAIGSQMAVRPVLYADPALLHNFFLPIFIPVSSWVNIREVRLKALGILQKLGDLIGFRTRYVSACSIVSLQVIRTPNIISSCLQIIIVLYRHKILEMEHIIRHMIHYCVTKFSKQKQKTNSAAVSAQAKYTDQAASAGLRI